MKTIKYILTAILLMIAYAANAQTIQLYKDGAVVKEYSSAEVDSVVYKPAAAEPRYYYYAGWDCPNSVEDLERLIDKEYPISNTVGETQFSKAGGEADITKSIINGETANTTKLCYGNKTEISNYKSTHGAYPTVYIAMPNGYSVYQSGGAIIREHHPIGDSHYYIEYGPSWSISNITISK